MSTQDIGKGPFADGACDFSIALNMSTTVFGIRGREGDFDDQLNVGAIQKENGDPLIKAMSKLEDPEVTGQARADGSEELLFHGHALFRRVFDTQLASGQTLADQIHELLVERHKDGAPLIAELHNHWAGLPIEMVRLPARYSPTGKESWLGEHCVISFVSAKQPHGKWNITADDFQGYSLFGQNLKFLDKERAYLSGLKHDGRDLFKVAGAFPASAVEDGAKVGDAMRLLKEGVDGVGRQIHCVTVAAHAEQIAEPRYEQIKAARADWKFLAEVANYQVCLDDGCYLTDYDLRMAQVRIPNLQFAYLNACSSFRMPEQSQFLGGLAGFALNELRAARTLAAICDVNSEGAHHFTQAFFDRFLPAPVGAGMPLGQAVFEARREVAKIMKERWENEGVHTGLCYRLVGRHDAAMEPLKPQARLAELGLAKGERVN